MTDEHWMQLALIEARRGVGRTAPNPPVGAVIVHNDMVLGSGWHHAAGQPHAEREALTDARARFGTEAARGATIYVTLEPCSTHGRTPPCTQGLIDAGVARVVYACEDRNPDHDGRAAALLTAAGIAVTVGVCRSEAERLLQPFFKVRTTGLPWVIWKTAMSLDGRITRPPGEGPWLTGAAAIGDVQLLRSTVDAILTSGATVRNDRPALTVRSLELLAGRQQPWRVVFSDAADSLPQDAPLFSDEWRERTLIRSGRDLPSVLRDLARDQGVLTAMTEAGGVFSSALFAAGLVDEVVIYYAPLLCGGPTLALADPRFSAALRLLDPEITRLGDDFRVRGLLAK